MNYVCTDCGKASEYALLVTQIGRESLKQRKTRLSGERADRVRAGLS